MKKLMAILFVLSIIASYGVVFSFIFEPKPVVVDYKEVTLGDYDTVWDVAKPYCPKGMSIDQYVYKIFKDNNVDIKPGSSIVIPIYKVVK